MKFDTRLTARMTRKALTLSLFAVFGLAGLVNAQKTPSTNYPSLPPLGKGNFGDELNETRTKIMDATEFGDRVWTLDGDALWSRTTSPSRDGVDAAASGDVDDVQFSRIYFSVAENGTVLFNWKVSSEEFFDYLWAEVRESDGTTVARRKRISGDTDWQAESMRLSAGQFMLFYYSKDGSVSVGQDRGWIDQVKFVPEANYGLDISAATSNQVFGVGNVDHIKVADVNSDGNFEIITVSDVNSEIRILADLMGDSPTNTQIGSGFGPYHTDVADFDNDGDLDIAAAYRDLNRIVWFRNDEISWQFIEATFDEVSNPSRVRTADINRDGNMDIVATAEGDGQLHVYLGDGTGSFTFYTVSTSSVLSSVTSLEVVDWDSDTYPDIITGDASGRIRRFSNTDGNPNNFSEQILIDSQLWPVKTITRDIDFDGQLEVVYADQNADRIYYLDTNDGGTTFTRTELLFADVIRDFELGDFNGDSFLDIAVVSDGEDRLYVYTNNGSLQFTQNVIETAFANPFSIEIADIDGDSDLDLALGTKDGIVQWYTNNLVAFVSDDGAPLLIYPEQRQRMNLDVGFTTHAVVDLDEIFFSTNGSNLTYTVNRAGDDVVNPSINPNNNTLVFEAVGTNQGTAVVTVEASNGTQSAYFSVDVSVFHITPTTFAEQQLQPDFFFGDYPWSVETGDINADGFPDFVTNGVWPDNDLQIFFSNGDLSFSPQALGSGGHLVQDIELSDLDLDGDLDIITWHDSSPFIKWWQNSDGSFISQNLPANTDDQDAFIDGAVRAVDLDNDGDLDILSMSDTALLWYENDGNQSFSERSIPFTRPEHLTVGDLDEDGDQDIIVSRNSGDELLWIRNDGSGSFSTISLANNLGSLSTIKATRIFDVDVDGDNDIIVQSRVGSLVFLLRNNGSNLFSVEETDLLGGSNFVFADFSSDGHYDFLTTNNAVDRTAYFENTGGFSFNENILSTSIRGKDVTSGDFDNDGDLDVIVISETTRAVYRYENLQTEDDLLVASYLFNGNFEDQTLNNIDGTATGNPGFVQSRFEDGAGALSLDGLDDYVELPAHCFFESGTATISGWVNLGQNPSNALYLFSGSSASLFVNNQGKARFTVAYQAGANVSLGALAPVMELNSWHHILGTYDGDVVKLYVNGELVQETPSGQFAGSIPDGESIKLIGRSGSILAPGTIDDIRVYDRAISEQEILEIYNEGGWDVLPRASIPMDFEDTGLDYEWVGFGGAFTSTEVNPDQSGENISATVMSLTKGASSETWAGAVYENLAEVIDFPNNGSTMQIKIWSPYPAGTNFMLKVENTVSGDDGNGGYNIEAETQAATTVQNQWEVLTFDFNNDPDFDPNGEHNNIVIFPDFGNAGSGTDMVTYIDDLEFAGSSNLVNIEFIVNAALFPDTLQTNHIIQLRGNTNGTGNLNPEIDWTNSSPAFAENIGGDYWRYVLQAEPGATLQYKWWAGVDVNTPLQNPGVDPVGDLVIENGWEVGDDRQIIVSNNDFNVVDWLGNVENVSPIPNVAGQIAVRFRVNVGAQVKAGLIDTSIADIQVRGGVAPLTWDNTTGLVLTKEINSAGDNIFYSGTVYFPESDFGGEVQYKFFATDYGWEGNVGEIYDNRHFVLGQDTTLKWKYFNNEIPSADQRDVTFNVDMTPAIDGGYFNPSIDEVYVRGTFNNFLSVPNALMSNIGGNTYSVSITLSGAEGNTAGYKYFIQTGDGRDTYNSGYELLTLADSLLNRELIFGPPDQPQDVGLEVFSIIELDPGLLAYYEFNGNGLDESGNGNELTFSGSTYNFTHDRFWDPTASINMNAADGNYATIAPNNAFSDLDEQGAISVWVKPGSFVLETNQILEFSGVGAEDQTVSLAISPGNPTQYRPNVAFGNGTGSSIMNSTILIDPAKWANIVVTWNSTGGSTQARMYVNNQLASSTTVTFGPVYLGNEIIIGQNSSFTRPFNGIIDELVMTSYEFSDQDVADIFDGFDNRLTVRDLNYYPFELTSANDIPTHPLAGQEVDLSLIIVSDPLNSGLANVGGDGYPARLHVFAIDTAAASLGREGMGIQIVQSSSNLVYDDVLSSLPGDIVNVRGTLSYFSNGAQLSLSEFNFVQEAPARYDEIIEPWYISISDIHEKNGERVTMRLENYSKYAGQLVSFSNVQIEQDAVFGGNTEFVLLGDGNTSISTYWTFLRYRNDRDGVYPVDFNFRRTSEGPWDYPAVGTRANVTGFLSVPAVGSDVFSHSDVSIADVFMINPENDGVLWDQGTQTFNDSFDFVELAAEELIAYYSFSGNTDDESGNSFNLTPINGPALTADRFGIPNSAYRFDGLNDYMQGPAFDDFYAGAPFTITSWFNWNRSDISIENILSFWTGSGTEMYLGVLDTQIRVGDAFGTTGVTMPDGEWTQIAATFDGTNVKLFVDGTLLAQANAYYEFGPLVVGRQGALNDEYFNGSIDDIRIYNYALSDQDIVDIYNSEVSTDPQELLIAHYPLDGNGDDISGFGNNASVNATTVDQDRFGNASSSYYFQSEGETITVPDNQIMRPTSAISVSAWVRPENAQLGYIFGKPLANQFQDNFNSFALVAHGDGSGSDPSFVWSVKPVDQGANEIFLTAPQQHSLNEWHHVVGTYDNGYLQLFVDGQLVADQNTPGTDIYYENNDFVIGDIAVPGEFRGKIDDVRMYNYALTEAEVRDLYQFGGWPIRNVVRITNADFTSVGDYNWTADNMYILDELVFVRPGSRLFIEAGTIIKGASGSNLNITGLVITRDAQIFAEGTSDNPIIFTAESDDLTGNLSSTDRGLWGGIAILGNAIINEPGGDAVLEGLDELEPVSGYSRFGGNDDSDNSGRITFVSIRHAGGLAGQFNSNEMNSIAFGAVGSQTVVDHVESFASGDDGFEFYGGTVRTKHMISSFSQDDAFDWDMGYRGFGQFWFVIQENATGEWGRSIEGDGATGDASGTPYAIPTFSNLTLFGAGQGVGFNNGDGAEAIYLRDNSGGYILNSILADHDGTAVNIEQRFDEPRDSEDRLLSGDLALENNIFFGFGSGSTFNAISGSQSYTANHLSDFTRGNLITDPFIGGYDRQANGGLDPRPDQNGPAFTNTVEIPADRWFDDVDFRGAFGQANWMKGWTALGGLGYFDNNLYEEEPGLEIQPELIAFYPFDGSLDDTSGNENDLTATGGRFTEDIQARTDSAYFVDGTANLTANALTYYDDQLSIAAWIRRQNASNPIVIVEQRDANGDDFQFEIDTNGELFFTKWDTDGLEHFASNTGIYVPPGVWSHVAVTFDARASDSNYKFYLNGLEAGSGAMSGNINSSAAQLFIGQSALGSEDLEGDIDQVEIYNYPLTAAQIEEIYNETTQYFDVWAYYPLDGSVADESGYGHGGSELDLSFNPIELNHTTNRFGDLDAALLVDGTGPFISLDGFGRWNFNLDFSVNVWFRPDRTAQNAESGDNIMQLADYGSVAYYPDGRISYEYRDNNGIGQSLEVNAGSQLSIAEWNMLTLTMSRDRSDLSMYLNGVEILSSVIPDHTAFSWSFVDLAPWPDNTRFFQGAFDDFTFLNFVVTPEEVLQKYFEDLGYDLGLTATSAAGGVVNLNWNAQTGVDSLEVFVSETLDFGALPDTSAQGNETSLSLTLEDGFYAIGVRSVFSNGLTTPFDTVFVEADGTAPDMFYAEGVSTTNEVYVAIDDTLIASNLLTSNWQVDDVTSNTTLTVNAVNDVSDAVNDGFWVYEVVLNETLVLGNNYRVIAQSLEDRLGNVAGPDTLTFIGDDDNENPSLVITQRLSNTEISDTVYFDYEISDFENDPVTLTFEYSLDDGSTYTQFDQLVDVTSNNYIGTYEWRTNELFEGQELFDVRVRVTPRDQDQFSTGIPVSFGNIHIDNNRVPVVASAAEPQGSTNLFEFTTFRDNVTFTYTVEDAESDDVNLTFAYRMLEFDGSDFVPRTDWLDPTLISSNTTVVGDGSEYRVVWDMDVDIPDSYLDYAQFGILPSDNDEGIGVTWDINIETIGMPYVFADADQAFDVVYTKDELVPITFSITDLEGDAVSITVQYSSNQGQNWEDATLSSESQTLYTSVNNQPATIFWDATADLGSGNYNDLFFRIVPYNLGGIEGVFAEFSGIQVNINTPPTLAVNSSPTGEVTSDTVRFQITVNDTERDNVNLSLEYSTNGITWTEGSISPETVLFSITGTRIVNLEWFATEDLGPVDNSYTVRITAEDAGGASNPVQRNILLDTEDGPELVLNSTVSLEGGLFYNNEIFFEFDKPFQIQSVQDVSPGFSIVSQRLGTLEDVSTVITSNMLLPNIITFTRPDGFPVGDVITITINSENGLLGVDGVPFDGNGNGDPDAGGVDDVTLEFSISYLADFNTDLDITVEDLDEFRTIWTTQDLTRDIGPASGTAPLFVPQPDGQIEFEDLMVFAQTWNWQRSQNVVSSPLASRVLEMQEDEAVSSDIQTSGTSETPQFTLPEGTDLRSMRHEWANLSKEDVLDMSDEFKSYRKGSLEINEAFSPVQFTRKESGGLYQQYDENFELNTDWVYHVTVDYFDTLSTVEFIVRYDPEQVRLKNIEKRELFRKEQGGTTVFLSYIDTLNGLGIINASNFGALYEMSRADTLAELVFESVSEAKQAEAFVGFKVINAEGATETYFDQAEISQEFELPEVFELKQNYPNPFNPSTTIQYHLAEKSDVNIDVYDVSGRKVASLVNMAGQAAGYYQRIWDASGLSSGVYIYVIVAQTETGQTFKQVKKMTLIK